MNKFSVIIPAYNSGKYIETAINSILNQGIECDIIVIDDGSIDNTKEVVLRYSNIKYIYQDNMGVSSARNKGLDYVKTPYFLFLDGDDYLNDGLLNEVNLVINNQDIIGFGINYVDESNNVLNTVSIPILNNVSGEMAIESLILSKSMFVSPCMYVFKTKYFKQFKFNVGKLHEDFGLIPEVIWNAKNISTINFVGLSYVQTTSSNVRGNSDESTFNRACDTLYFYGDLKVKLDSSPLNNKSLIASYLANSAISSLNELSGSYRDKYLEMLNECGVVNDLVANSFLQKLKKFLYKINLGVFSKYV